LTVALLVAACASRPTSAPVVDRGATSASRGASQGATAAGVHVVQRGETLYSIALEHGVDYRDLAAWNGLGDGTHIRVGQALQLGPRERRRPRRRCPRASNLAVRRARPAGLKRARSMRARLRPKALATARPRRAPRRCACRTRRRTWRCCPRVGRRVQRRPLRQANRPRLRNRPQARPRLRRPRPESSASAGPQRASC